MENSNEKVTPEKKKFSMKDVGKKELLLLFLAGIILVMTSIPGLFQKKDKTKETENSVKQTSIANAAATKDDAQQEYISYYENKLKSLLEKMEGVGKVEVMITLQSSKEQVVLKDSPYTQESLNETDKEGGTRISSNSQNQEETVLITTQEGETIPYVTKEMEASVEGVVVLAQGGGDGNIATKIVNAVGVLFDVPSHKVQVLKMEE